MSTAFTHQGPARLHPSAAAPRRGDLFQAGPEKHWLVDSLIANPMSGYPKYREKRSSWGIGVLGSLVVEIETEDGTVGVATGSWRRARRRG